MNRALAVACLIAASLAVAAASAAAQSPPPAADPTFTQPPPGWRLSPRDTIERVRPLPEVQAEMVFHPEAEFRTEKLPVGKNGKRAWRILLAVHGDDRQGDIAVISAIVDDRTGAIVELWTGLQAEWELARGRPGLLGGVFHHPALWIGLCLLFLAPFLRPPLRMIHLDLAVLLSWSVSYAFLNDANLALSVPTSYLPLGYFLIRMMRVASHRGPPPETWMPAAWLLGGLVVVMLARYGLTVFTSEPIDVAAAGVIGADAINKGEVPYGHPGYFGTLEHGDTYGPVMYLLYAPFELLWPYDGNWGRGGALRAGLAATITFDLAVTGLLYLLGRRLEGKRTGLLLAWMWVTFPFSNVILNSNSNDALPAAFILAALLASGAAGRGVLVALAGMAKIAQLALAPLFLAPGRVRYIAAFVLTAVPLAVLVSGGDLELLYDRTVAFQQNRWSPVSLIGWYETPELVPKLLNVLAVVFALVVAFMPRPRDVVATSALATAILIVLQFGAWHWFYLYLGWFVPLILVALLVPRGPDGPVTAAA